MLKHFYPAIVCTLIMATITGLIFPFIMTAIATTAFPDMAGGSLIKSADGKISGSTLLAQSFKNPGYFHPRPSAAGDGYNATASGGTNLGPTSKKLVDGNGDHSFVGIKDLAKAYRQENGLPEKESVPVDAVTRSGSGLDPDISLQNAYLQMHRISKARNIGEQQLNTLIEKTREHRQLGFIGESRVNVLKLNLALDKISHN